ncbi:MAG: hypothetical protein DWQ30_17865 [Acidobacteria bacterium]|nr:MAG: hypothetical protein DWQ30_17865 [Acidobacteriota bacterium]
MNRALSAEPSCHSAIAVSPRASRRGSRALVAFLAVVTFVAVVSAGAAAQETAGGAADPLADLLARHYEARGGLEVLRAVDTMHVEGVAKAQGMELGFEIWRQRPTFYRQQMSMQGMQSIQAYDGAVAWGVNPMTGSSKPAPLPEGLAATTILQADFDGVLVDWKRKRAKLELGDVVDLGAPLGKAHVIEATLQGGGQQTFYIGVEDHLLRRTVQTADQGMGPVEVTVDFVEYAEVGGLKVPKRQVINSAMGRAELEFTRTELDVDVDPEIFYMPGQTADASLSLDQILERHFAARGGAEGVQTVRATGKLGFMGLNIPLVISLAKPGKSRLEADMAGSKMILAYDGEQAWTVSPLQAIATPEALSAEAADLIELFGGFLWGILEQAQADGWALSLTGVETVGRDETYAIEMKQGEQVRRAFLGGEDFLERRFSLDAEFMGTQQQIDALLTLYAEQAGLMVPRSITLNSGGAPVATVELEAVETGVSFAEGHFSMPPAETPAEQ